MSSYLAGILAAIAEPIVHAWSNIIDSNFSNHVFPKLSILVLFGMLFNLVFLPVVILISKPHFISIGMAGLVFCIALIETLYLFPYYWSLKTTDTSIVASLFALGEAAIPFLAFIFLNERLALLQYFGFGIIIVSAIMLTFDRKKFRFNASFFFMLAASLILAVEAVLYKYVYLQGVSWGSVVVYGTMFQILIILPIALYAGFDAIKEGIARIRSAGWLFVVNEFLGSTGNLSGSFALSVLPASITKGIGASQPAFVLGYAYLFRKKHSTFFKEGVSKRESAKKIFFFALTIVGVILVAT